jgi:hypothetical protein
LTCQLVMRAWGARHAGRRRDRCSGTATLDDDVKDGAALAGIGIAQEQPVLLSKSGRPNGVFHEIVVYLDSAIFEIDAKQGPGGERVIDGLAKGAARQVTAGRFEEVQSAVQTLANRTRGDIGTCCIAGELRVLGRAGPLDGGANPELRSYGSSVTQQPLPRRPHEYIRE